MDNNGIFEPGEIVTVSKVTVRNDGQLPTPPNQKTKIFIANRDWVVTDGTEVEIPRSLNPGESYTLPESFQFKIKDAKISTVGPRFVTSDHIQPLAHILEVQRFHPNFDAKQSFEITFPVEITPITGLRSLAPGEETKISFKITNVSSRDLGSLSDLKRQIQFTLSSMGGNMNVHNVILTNASGQTVKLEDVGTTTGVDVLKAGESFVMEGAIRLAPDTEAFTTHSIGTTLTLQHPVPARSAEVYPVQNQEFKVSAAQTFKLSPNPGILLVTNSETSKGEAAAWGHLGQLLGLSVDIWDASYYGKLPLLEDQKGQSLAEMYKNKTIVLLDNDWKTSGSGNTVALRNSDLLKKNEFLKVAASYGINVVLMGSTNSAESILEKFYFPIECKKDIFLTTGEFDRSMNKRSSDVFDLNKVNEVFAEIEFSRWQWFGKPRVHKVARQADRLMRKLISLASDDQYVVAYQIDAEPVLQKKLLWGLFKQYHLGTLQVRRALSKSLGLVASVSGKEQDIHNPAFVTSEETLFAFFTALPVEKRAEIISRALTDSSYAKKLQDSSILPVLLNATLAEVAFEQAKASPKNIAEHVQILDLLAKEAAKVDSMSEESQKIFSEFLAELIYFSNSQTKWWMYFVPISSQRSISGYLKRKTYAIIDALAGDKEVKRKITDMVKQRFKELKAMAKEANPKDGPAQVLNRYTSGIHKGGYVNWSHVVDLVSGKTYEASAIDEITERSEQRVKKQSELEELIKSERCNLLLGTQ